MGLDLICANEIFNPSQPFSLSPCSLPVSTHIPEFWSDDTKSLYLPHISNNENHFPAGERVHEVVTYDGQHIREAHPVDGWWLGGGIPGLLLKLSGSKAATDVYDPQTMEERRTVAG